MFRGFTSLSLVNLSTDVLFVYLEKMIRLKTTATYAWKSDMYENFFHYILYTAQNFIIVSISSYLCSSKDMFTKKSGIKP